MEMITSSLALPKEYREEADSMILQNLLRLPEYQNASTVFCFIDIGHEIDRRPFLQRVMDDGRRFAVPLCIGEGKMEHGRLFHLMN
jgi:5-formyltetrahydrofolate cyclo-ligase